MATGETPHTAADSAPAAPNPNPSAAGESVDKANGNGSWGNRGNRGNRGNKGGRDRGNDKQKKRKHTGFGSAKYVATSAFYPAVSHRRH